MKNIGIEVIYQKLILRRKHNNKINLSVSIRKPKINRSNEVWE